MTTATLPEPRQSNKLKWGLLFLVAAFILIAVMLAVAFTQSGAPTEQAILPETNSIQAAALQTTSAPLLVWVAKGAAPGSQSASEPGQLAYLGSDGVAETVLELPAQVSRVESCGDTALSPDGSTYAFYVGLDKGSLYAMHEGETPVKVSDVQALTCLGGGTFQYSPDGSQLGYISYEGDAATSEFADGFLHIASTSDFSEVYSYENVTAFDLTETGAAFVSFFTNDQNEADEAAIMVWNGSGQQEVATLNPASDDCKFTSASIAGLADGKLLLVLGHRCKSGDTTTNWQLYSVDPADRSATLAASASQPGAFASFARSNRIYLSPEGDQALFTVPDGITANTVGLKRVSVENLSLADVLDKQVVAATYNGAPNAFPRVSPDGNWLTAVVTSPNGENSLYVWSLTDPAVAPIMVSAGSTGDTVSSLAFTPDSSRLLAVVGGADTASNSLIAIETANGRDSRIARGHFGKGLTISPDGSTVALLDWQIPSDTTQQPYTNLVSINLNDGSTTTLYTGADVVDGKVSNQRFAFPMTWIGAAQTTTTASG
ncbi:MAG: hypothetical protein LCI00_32520 [Chloroflexi bacterium]|nr:hypothetical protein [Chloroflexota bacterium]MCC6894665.1 PD40 domain-containing protein [Anaerolineae bacterium]